MKNFVGGIAVGIAGGVAAALFVSSSNAQTPAATAMQESPVVVRAPVTPAAGSLQVQRLNDTQFVVVKDMGDQQIVTLFNTEGGLIKKQHAGKFLY